MYPVHHIGKPEPRRANATWGTAFFTHFLQHLSSRPIISNVTLSCVFSDRELAHGLTPFAEGAVLRFDTVVVFSRVNKTTL